RNLVQLNIATTGPAKVRDLVAEDAAEIRKKILDRRIGAAVREIRATEEVHGRRRGQGDLRRGPGDAAKAEELDECRRALAPERGRGIGGGERDLVSMVVAEFERGGLDDKSLHPLDEAAPIGAAAEFPVGHHLQADVLLQRDGIADAAILNLCKRLVIDAVR